MSVACQGCRDGDDFPMPFTMAFHPIVDVAAGEIWGYEALVRGTEGQGAYSVLQAVTEANRYVFDQACRVKAIELAGANLPRSSKAHLSINFMPNAVYEPRACIRATLAAAARTQFDPKRLMFEFTENERMDDVAHVANIVAEYKRMGFMTALCGAGPAGQVPAGPDQAGHGTDPRGRWLGGAAGDHRRAGRHGKAAGRHGPG
jgi:EAL domain-containing protein (putative c-di-GMP-specific phosphodiesterase class I)